MKRKRLSVATCRLLWGCLVLLCLWRLQVIWSAHKEASEQAQQVTGSLNGIQIVGSVEFSRHTYQALKRLDQCASWKSVRPYIAVIREAKESGMVAYASRPTYGVGSNTWRNSLLWYASTIVHDGYHSRLYHLGKAWTGKEAERQCLRVQLQAIRELGGDRSVEAYLQSLILNPTYQNIPLDKRDW